VPSPGHQQAAEDGRTRARTESEGITHARRLILTFYPDLGSSDAAALALVGSGVAADDPVDLLISAITSFAFLPWYPIWALVIITLDVFVIWALTAHGRDITRA